MIKRFKHRLRITRDVLRFLWSMDSNSAFLLLIEVEPRMTDRDCREASGYFKEVVKLRERTR